MQESILNHTQRTLLPNVTHVGQGRYPHPTGKR